MKTKKWELIKQAYENYPKGTKFTWGQAELISNGKFRWYKRGDLDAIGTDEGVELKCVYDGEKWAEIVTKEKTEDKPQPLLTSEDGFELFERDSFTSVRVEDNDICYLKLSNFWEGIENPDKYKAFKNKKNALAWIEEHNSKLKTTYHYAAMKSKNGHYLSLMLEDKSILEEWVSQSKDQLIQYLTLEL